MKTCHSEYGRLHSVLVKPAVHAFRSQRFIDRQWEKLNYRSAPDLSMACSEYEDFLQLLKGANTEILQLPDSGSTSMDSMYCRDASLATDYGMVICNMGKPARNAEPADQKAFFESAKIPVLGAIKAPGTLEGGDTVWLDPVTLAVGHTYRSNLEGIRQLQQMLEPRRIEVIRTELPHFRGPSDVFHLMSIISPVDQGLAMVYSPLMPVGFRKALLQRGYELIECPEEEFDSLGCNVLAIAPGKCVVTEGNPVTRSRLEAHGCEVMTYAGHEISYKGCGGPTCLTRPLYREV